MANSDRLFTVTVNENNCVVEVSEQCAPLVQNADGKLERDHGGASWPSDDEIAAEVKRQTGREVKVKFHDSGDSLLEGVYYFVLTKPQKQKSPERV